MFSTVRSAWLITTGPSINAMEIPGLLLLLSLSSLAISFISRGPDGQVRFAADSPVEGRGFEL